MIVDAAWYVAGMRTLETDSIERLAAERGGAGFGWLGLRMPSDDELDQVRDAFDLPELAINDARAKHDRPKVERHEDCLLIVVPTARYVDEREEVEFGELFFYAGRDYMLTVRYGHAAPWPGSVTSWRSVPICWPTVRVLCFRPRLLHVVESYVPVIEGLEHDVREVERDVFSESRIQPTKRIYFLVREVLDFLVALEPMSASLKRLTSAECIPWVHPDIVPLFRDVDDALAEIVERGRTLHHLLNNALTASRTEASIRQNEDTRKISAWAALLVVPTVVSGMFGMNLGGIPGSQHGLGFVTVTALTVLISFALYRQFKKTDWL